jgi:dTDP-4-amino-4,6-dideoxygalactose transaminase
VIPIAKPWIGEAEVNATARVLRSGWITQGPEVAAFEKEFASTVGAPYACAVSNCTTALQLALEVTGVGPGDEVITVSHSFIATANAIRACGAVPVFADIDPSTYNLNPAGLDALVSPRTKAVLCVHQMGMPCDLARILPWAEAHGLFVIEDAACAIGSEILWNGRWERIGKPHGHAAAFSFHPRKLLTTGDGGMITTRDPEWDRRFRLRRQHGMSVPDTVRHGSPTVVFESYLEPAHNFRMTDLQAAVGREQLRRLDDLVRLRRSLADRYRELLASIPGLGLPEEPAWARTNWQSYAVRLPEGADQRRVMQGMLDDGISTRRGIMNAHREPAYQNEPWRCAADRASCGCLPGCCRALAHSEAAQDHCIILPLHHELSASCQEAVATSLWRHLMA